MLVFPKRRTRIGKRRRRRMGCTDVKLVWWKRVWIRGCPALKVKQKENITCQRLTTKHSDKLLFSACGVMLRI